MFDNFWVAYVVGATPRRNRHHVQLRVGALSQIDGGGAGQLRVPGAVGGQQDLGREDAHLLASFSSAVRSLISSPRCYYTQRGQEPSDRKDGRFSATLRAEGGTHRPCVNSIKARMLLQWQGAAVGAREA